MYEIELSKKAAKFYRKADAATARRLNTAFDRLAEASERCYPEGRPLLNFACEEKV
jgi:hypothetical protein